MRKHTPVLALFALTVAPHTAFAQDCEPPELVVAQAEQAVLEGRHDDMKALIARFDASLSCSGPIPGPTLAAFFRAEGAYFHSLQYTDESNIAFASAQRLDPNVWTEAFGSTLKEQFTAAASPANTGVGTVRLDPLPHDPTLVLMVDGQQPSADAGIPVGLHAIQLIRGPDAFSPNLSRFGRVITVYADQETVVNPGVLTHESPAEASIQRPRRPVWLLGTAGGAALVAGLTAGLASHQGKVVTEATSLAEVNQRETAQQRYAYTSYTTMGIALIAGGVYFAF